MELELFNNGMTKEDIKDQPFREGCRGIIKKDDISEIKSIPWSINKVSATFGSSFLFFKPLVMLKAIYGSIIYIRADNAQHLEEDLKEWLNKS